MPDRALLTATSQVPGSKKFGGTWKRFQPSPHLPMVVLDGEGTIEHVTPTARRILEYGADDRISPCFFSLVHGRNIYQVMRDIADMVCYGKPRANWLIRLRTGRGRWHWFRAKVRNRLHEPDPAIHIVLDDV